MAPDGATGVTAVGVRPGRAVARALLAGTALAGASAMLGAGPQSAFASCTSAGAAPVTITCGTTATIPGITTTTATTADSNSWIFNDSVSATVSAGAAITEWGLYFRSNSGGAVSVDHQSGASIVQSQIGTGTALTLVGQGAITYTGNGTVSSSSGDGVDLFGFSGAGDVTANVNNNISTSATLSSVIVTALAVSQQGTGNASANIAGGVNVTQSSAATVVGWGVFVAVDTPFAAAGDAILTLGSTPGTTTIDANGLEQSRAVVVASRDGIATLQTGPGTFIITATTGGSNTGIWISSSRQAAGADSVSVTTAAASQISVAGGGSNIGIRAINRSTAGTSTGNIGITTGAASLITVTSTGNATGIDVTTMANTSTTSVAVVANGGGATIDVTARATAFGIRVDQTVAAGTGNVNVTTNNTGGAHTINVTDTIVGGGASAGIFARNQGSGTVTVTSASNINGGGAGAAGITGISTAAITGLNTVNITGGTIQTQNGIGADSTGTGGVTVNMTGGQIGSNGNAIGGIGIAASTSGTAGNINVTSTAIFSTGNGINAQITNAANAGNVVVNANGNITSAATAINASTAGAGLVNITIANGATVNGATFGINATGPGTILNLGTITSAGTAAQFEGTLQIGNGGTTGAVNGNIVNDGTVIANRSNALTLAGAISGAGSFQQNGAGTTTLTGVNTYNGATTVNAGTLAIAAGGSIASAATVNNGGTFVVNGASGAATVNNGGVLMGTGTVGNTTINGGTLSPGNSIGTLTVAGNLVMTAAAAYIVEISPSAADRTNVTGAATIAGTVNAVFATGAYLQRSYTIISAGARTGTFASLTTSNLPAGFTSNLSYAGNDVLLNLVANLAPTPTPTGPNAIPNDPFSANQRNVANALNSFFNNGGALPPVFVGVFGLTGANLANTLTQLSGQHATGAQQAANLSMGMFLSSMLDPFVAGRNGGFGGNAIGYAQETAHPAEQAFAAAMPVKARPRSETFENRWSVWGSSYGGRNRTDGDAGVGSNDLRANAAGFAGGIDYRVAPGTVLGVATAIGETRWNVSGLGRGDANVAQFGGYASTRFGDGYLSGAVAGAWHRADTQRSLNIAGTDQLEADFNARSFGARAEGGWRFGMMSYGITPYAAVQVQSLRTPNYSERATFGSNQFALTYAAQRTTDTRSELGGWVDTRHALDNGMALTLRARAAWVHDFNPGSRINAAFQTLPGASFTVDGAGAPRDSALTSAVAEIGLRNGVTLTGKVDGEFSDRSRTYAGTGTLKYAW